MKNTSLYTIAAWVLAIIGLIIFAFSTDKDGAIGAYVTYALILLVITSLIALAFSVSNIFKNPELLKKVLMGVGVLVALLVVSYIYASNEAVFSGSGEQLIESGSVSKWVGTGVVYSIILLIIGAGLFLWDMVKNAVK
jgi:chromate transport protein ChrA